MRIRSLSSKIAHYKFEYRIDFEKSCTLKRFTANRRRILRNRWISRGPVHWTAAHLAELREQPGEFTGFQAIRPAACAARLLAARLLAARLRVYSLSPRHSDKPAGFLVEVRSTNKHLGHLEDSRHTLKPKTFVESNGGRVLYGHFQRDMMTTE